MHTGEAGLTNGAPHAGHTIAAHSLDYDEFLEFDGERETDERFAVFLDEYMVHHSDYLYSHLVPPTTEGHYFPALNRFFDVFEARTGMRRFL